MEKKWFYIGGAGLFLGSIGLLALMIDFLKPAELKEAGGSSGIAADFPGTREETNLRPPSWESQRVRATEADRSSSLGFVKSGQDYAGTGTAQGNALPGSSAEASEAAARGDAKGLVAGLDRSKSAGIEGGPYGQDAVWTVMKGIVDTVHKVQPSWYEEFLANRNLKAIADRYNKDYDFATFIRLLAKSKSFHAMLKKRRNTAGMRKLTTALNADGALAPKVEKLFFENNKDENILKMVRLYGEGSGLPEKLLNYAGVKVKKRKQRTARQRPRLKSGSGFTDFRSGGGGFTRSPLGGGAGGGKSAGAGKAGGAPPGGLPPGMPDMSGMMGAAGAGGTPDVGAMMKNLPAGAGGMDPEMLKKMTGQK